MKFVILIAVFLMIASVCSGSTNSLPQKRRLQMEKPTTPPSRAPTFPPTHAPTRSPTRFPTSYPTSFPTEKKGGMNLPVARVTNAPVSFATGAPSLRQSGVIPTTPSPTNVLTEPPMIATAPPVTSHPTKTPTTKVPVTSAPITSAPSIAISNSPTELKITDEPSSSPTEMPLLPPLLPPVNDLSTDSPVAFSPIFPTVSPTGDRNLTSSLQLDDFSILLLSTDLVVNVDSVEMACEEYMLSNMNLENLVTVTLSPKSASSARGGNVTSTSIRFGGFAAFKVEVPTQSVLSTSQTGALASTSKIQDVFNDNTNLVGVRVVAVGYAELDPNSIVENNEESNPDAADTNKSNTGAIVSVVLILSILVIAGGIFTIRRRKLAKAKEITIKTESPSIIKSMYVSPYNFPDIEKPQSTTKESVHTPSEDDDDDSESADLSSYIMTPTSTPKVVVPTKISERPEEISVSHIGEAEEDGYLSTDDESARFGATDMSECTFRD